MAKPLNPDKEDYVFSCHTTDQVRDMLEELKNELGISKRRAFERGIKMLYQQEFGKALPAQVEAEKKQDGVQQ